MPPVWLTVVAWLSLSAGFLCAAAIVVDIYGSRRRQPMRVMEAVWPITALYLGPLGWTAYRRLGRPTVSPAAVAEGAAPATMDTREGAEGEPAWHGVAVSSTHCGAGCALGDLIGEWVIFAASLTIAGVSLWASYLLDFSLAYLFGIAFQYWAIFPMSDLTPRLALVHALQADTLSIIAFQAGMFAWMALVFFVLFPSPHLSTASAAYWLMMQIAMTIGLLTTYPVNRWLVGRGVKHPMSRPVVPAPAGA